MNTLPQEYTIWIEIAVAIGVALATVGNAAINLRARHRRGEGWHVYVGALVNGALVGILIGFVLLPLRSYMVSDGLPREQLAASVGGFILVVITLRRGWVGKLPILGPQLRAYRRANLRRIIETSQAQLDKLTSHDERRQERPRVEVEGGGGEVERD